MASLPAEIRAVLDLHRRQLFGLVEVRGVRQMRRLYASARSDLEDRLASLVRAGRGQTFGAHHLRIVLLQVTQATRAFQDSLGDHLERTGRTAANLAPRHLVDAVNRMGAHFGATTPLVHAEQAGIFAGVVPGVMPSLLDRFEVSRKLYGPPVIREIRQQLALAVLKKQPLDETVDAIAGVDGTFANARWRAERIARTETAYAYGVAQHRGMQALERRMGKRVLKKLIETDDDREGEDSKLLHGQVRPVDEPFVYKPPPGKKGYPPFLMPPGRPNDRAVVIPWMADWPESAQTSTSSDGAEEVGASTRGLPG